MRLLTYLRLTLHVPSKWGASMSRTFRVEVDGNINAAIKLRKIADEAKDNVVNTLNTQGKVYVEKQIKALMPVSKKAKQHAKYSDSLQVMTMGGRRGFRNLGFYMQPAGSFWYLKFPNNGSGTSRNNTPLQFMQRGIYSSVGYINNLIDQAVTKAL